MEKKMGIIFWEFFSVVWKIGVWMEQGLAFGIFATRVFDVCLFFEACAHSIQMS
jgi:hypothetical protein